MRTESDFKNQLAYAREQGYKEAYKEAYEKAYKEEYEKWFKIGYEEERIRIAERMRKLGYPEDLIAEVTTLPEKD